MQIAAILSHLESIAPLALQEKYDNAGLLTGSGEWECSGVLVTLDATEAVVREAIGRKCNLIVAHHPIIFGGLKKITGKNYVERTVISAIKNDIAIYAIHTNLDNVLEGVNGKMAAQLGLINCRPLLPKEGILQKLFTFVPSAHLEAVRNAIFSAGGGQIGQYSECSFTAEGEGTFKGGEDTHPFVGQPGLRHGEKETRLEVILPSHISRLVVAAMIGAHPYEEPAYDLVELSNTHPGAGAGLIGELPEMVEEKEFLARISQAFRLQALRHTPLTGRPVKRCALCGGAGSFLISKALAAGADFYITADVKYHEFFDADGGLVIADIGHFESEQFTIDLLFDILREKFPNFAVLKSDTRTNPVNYYS
jgi:dinuclear metal center YbgI/SA1388 family protein